MEGFFDCGKPFAQGNACQPAKRDVVRLELFHWHRWIALVGLVGLDQACTHPRLGSNLASIGNFQVPSNAHLATNHASGSDFGGSSNTSLCCNDSGFPNDHVVGDLDQIVQFAALLDQGAPKGCPVNGGVGADVAEVFNDDVASLRDFGVRAILNRSEAKTVASNHRAALQDTLVANHTTVKHTGVAVQDSVRANAHPPANVNMRMQFGAVPNHCALFHNNSRSDVASFADFGIAVYMCSDMDAFLPLQKGIIRFQEVGECAVGVFHTEQGQFRRKSLRGHKVVFDNDDTCLRCEDEALVFRVGNEGNRPRTCRFNFCETLDAHVGIASDASAEQDGQFRCCFFQN